MDTRSLPCSGTKSFGIDCELSDDSTGFPTYIFNIAARSEGSQPARFIPGHARWDTPPPDFHALIECHADGQWRLFDPTAMTTLDEVICIGKGLDAAQVPFCTLYGSYRMTRRSPMVTRLAPRTEIIERRVPSLEMTS